MDNPVELSPNSTKAQDSQPERREDSKHRVVLRRQLLNSSPPLKRAIHAYRKLDLTGSRREPRSRVRTKRALQLNKGQISHLLERYQAGASVYALAAEFRIDRRTVSDHLHRHGVPLRLTPVTDEQAAVVASLYREGLSTAQVAIQVHRDPAVIYRTLKRVGIPTRDTHGRPRLPKDSPQGQ